MSDQYPQFSPEHDIFRSQLRKYVENELFPHIDEWEKARIFPREVFTDMGKRGFLGIRFPEELGGLGLDYWFTTVLAEELPRCGAAGLPMSIMVQTDMATPVIDDLGTPEQKEEFLRPVITGEKIAALGVSEPNAGSDVASILTTARRVGDEYIVNGSKTFITNGTRADFITLLVRTGDQPGFGSISILLFPTDVKGFSVSGKLEKIGNHCSDTAELAFDECRIPARYLLGQENMGFYYLMRNFQGERLVGSISAMAGVGLTMELTRKYVDERKAFGRPVSKFQTVKHLFAEMETRRSAGQALAYHCADLYNRKVECTKEISMAKLYCGETANWITDRCLQLHGGYGYMDEYHVSRAWRDGRLITIGGGTSEVMKEIISKYMGM
jgi:citronellyl-CoA dehydrogenase